MVLRRIAFNRSAFFSVADQGTAALALFLFSVFATRALPTSEFGLISVSLAWASLLSAVLQSMLIDGSTILAARDQEGGHRYTDDVAYFYVWLSVALLLLAVALSLLFPQKLASSPAAVAWLLASEVCVSFVAFLRRRSYVGGDATGGWGTSFICLVLTVFVMPLVVMRPEVAAVHVFLARALINGLAALVTLCVVRKKSDGMRDEPRGKTLQATLRFSSPYVLGSLLFWATSSIQVALIGHVLDLSEAAGYRVAQLLVLPAIQIQAAVYQLMLPKTVSSLAKSPEDASQHLRRLLHAFAWPTLAYATVISTSAHWLLGVLFGSQYQNFDWVVVALAVLTLLDAAKQAAVVVLYAQNRQALFVRYRVVALAMFLVTTVPALLLGDLRAVLLATAVSNVLQLAYLFHGFMTYEVPVGYDSKG